MVFPFLFLSNTFKSNISHTIAIDLTWEFIDPDLDSLRKYCTEIHLPSLEILGLVKHTLKVEKSNYPIRLVLNNCVKNLFPPFSKFTLSINIY